MWHAVSHVLDVAGAGDLFEAGAMSAHGKRYTAGQSRHRSDRFERGALAARWEKPRPAQWEQIAEAVQ